MIFERQAAPRRYHTPAAEQSRATEEADEAAESRGEFEE